MKRFVDLTEALEDPCFAWWDTVVDCFETHSGYMAWDSWEDFAEDFEGSDLARYRVLCPFHFFRSQMQ